MEELVREIERLQDSPISEVISERMLDFGKVSNENLFGELCFCLMTANFKADKCIEIQNEIGDGFEKMSLNELLLFLKKKGHRFWPQRAERIYLAREHKDFLKTLRKMDSREARTWLVKNVKGLGMKEASHFLRNIGVRDVAIIDFHIIDLLKKMKMICLPQKTLTPQTYQEVEKVLISLGKKVELSLAELDLFLWYIETKKVLK